MHRLPLEANAPHRISLTFRSIVPGWEDRLAHSAAAGGRGQGGGGGGDRMDDCVS
jgi:hypothetical protein